MNVKDNSETERRFIVEQCDEWKKYVLHSSYIRQGYLARIEGGASVRVRIETTSIPTTPPGEFTHEATLNIKQAIPGDTRPEFEFVIDVKAANEMLDLMGQSELLKERHRVKHHGHTWEIDIFTGRHAGLVIAELELPTPESAFVIPSWVGKEVTHDESFSNYALSMK